MECMLIMGLDYKLNTFLHLTDELDAGDTVSLPPEVR